MASPVRCSTQDCAKLLWRAPHSFDVDLVEPSLQALLDSLCG